jgi:hypothetical protein
VCPCRPLVVGLGRLRARTGRPRDRRVSAVQNRRTDHPGVRRATPVLIPQRCNTLCSDCGPRGGSDSGRAPLQDSNAVGIRRESE